MFFKGDVIFLRILLPAIAGIYTGLHLPASAFVVYFLMAASLFVLAGLLVLHLRYLQDKLYLHRWLPGFISQIFLFLAFCTIAVTHHPLYPDNHFSKCKTEALLVQISSEPRLSNKTIRFEANVEQGLSGDRLVPLCGKMLLVVYSDEGFPSIPDAGSRLMIPAVYKETEPPLNPYEFNYRQYLSDQGICHQSFFYSSQLQLLNTPAKKSINLFALSLRKQMVARFRKYIKDEDASAIASTLILGYKASLSTDVITAYSVTGVMHVLSVSGMHVALVMTMLMYLLRFMGRNGKLRIVQALIIIIIIWFYTLLTGLSPAACRAAVMISFVITGKALNRDSNMFNSIAASAVLLLIYHPYFLKDIGFQLSYLAVAGLVYFYPRIYRLITIGNWPGDKIWGYTSLSLSAQIATFPLSLYYFNQFPLYFLFSNLFIVLPVTLIMYAGIAFLLLPFDPVSEALGWFLSRGILWVNKGLFYIEDLPYSGVHGAKFGLWYYLLIYTGMLFLTIAFQYKRKSFFYGTLAVLFLLTVINSFRSFSQYHRKEILLFNVRKNTAIGFFNGCKANIITNLDEKSKAFSYSVSPFISAQNYSTVKFYPSGQPISHTGLYSDGHFYEFEGRRLLLYDPSFNGKDYTGSITVHYLLINGNPQIRLEKLSRYVKFDLLLISNNNSDYHIRSWLEEARKLRIKYYLLKNSPAVQLSIAP